MNNSELRALQSGDSDAFRELIQTYHNALVTAVKPLVGEAQCEEVVQEAWIKVHHSISSFEGRSSIKTWLFSIALNEARMHLRRHKQERSQTVDTDEATAMDSRFKASGSWAQPPIDWESDSPDDLLMQDNLLDCLRKHLARLPVNQANLVRLRDIEGLAFDRICNDLEISASNARVLLHRARATLYRMLEGYKETGEC